MKETFRLGSRASPLAMVQAHLVQSLLAASLGIDIEQLPITRFTTTGDRIQDRLLQEAGGKGLFTKELDEALLEDRIDAAIHSMKDLPTRLPAGLVLNCVPSREDPRDAWICPSAPDLDALPAGATVGTASLRRQAQLLHLRPDLKVVPLRGSVETRLRRIAEGAFDATFLALAGLTRLGLADRATSIIELDRMPSAAGQGALAIVCRSDDLRMLDAFAPLNQRPFDIATRAERSFLDALDGSCRTPIGAYAKIDGDRLRMLGEVLTPDGAQRWRHVDEIALGDMPEEAAETLGRRLGQTIRADAGDAYVSEAVTAW